ncbi:PIR protein [Plasmodium yoelii]|uniref:PIR protein n=2 Tax=Plasmodium yoelii TaxID=5861 RepID=A0AAE9WKA9_PLAYO|nr:PIR protein [Plasmodium yoelii]WBY55121.1 PIR protein [Plasmodium yoelii yoelii]CDU16374.1 YIR protein [Plasmodium yoelii]VTZ72705.1 PIR protein [Plasmodium yoelii]|eukprot:XP_022811502.1 PIR protein [Plasmodium yoelii]
MDSEICKRFKNVREWLPDQLDIKKEYQIKDKHHLNEYCTSGCDSSLDKISAGCLYLFNEFFRDSSVFEAVAKENFYVVEYILIWLSYMLNLTKTQENNSIEIFYNTYVKNGDKYINNIKYFSGCDGYKDLIDRSDYLLSMDMSIISKLYYAFNTLCDIYNELDTNKSNCAKCLEKVRQFIEKYEEFNIDYNNAENIPYFNVLLTLLNGYDNLKNKCEDFPSIPGIPNEISEHVSEVKSSSSIFSKLIPVVLIFSAISIFLGISYKYSLFGFRKRFKKQQIREKIKNIKKIMNH